jgi:hypothetical protein
VAICLYEQEKRMLLSLLCSGREQTRGHAGALVPAVLDAHTGSGVRSVLSFLV